MIFIAIAVPVFALLALVIFWTIRKRAAPNFQARSRFSLNRLSRTVERSAARDGWELMGVPPIPELSHFKRERLSISMWFFTLENPIRSSTIFDLAKYVHGRPRTLILIDYEIPPGIVEELTQRAFNTLHVDRLREDPTLLAREIERVASIRRVQR